MSTSIKSLFFGLCALVCASTGQTAPSETSYSLTLADLGFRQGHVFQGERAPHGRAFYFPLPLDGGADGATFRLRYRASSLSLPLSSLRVDVNDRPGQLIKLGEQQAPEWVEVSLNREDLRKPVLKLTVSATIVASDNKCLDQRSLPLNFVHLLPESELVVRTPEGTAKSVAAAWSSLPANVRISLPESVSEATFATAVEAAMVLRQMQRTVTFVRHPQMGDVVIAEAATLKSWFALDDEPAAAGSVRRISTQPDRTVILLASAASPSVLAPTPWPWQTLLKGEAYQYPALRPVGRGDGMAVDLIAAGFGDTRFVADQAEWSLNVAPPLVRPGRQLSKLILNVVASPGVQNENMLINVFVNGVLQEVRPLAGDGKPHTVSFALSDASQRASGNQLRIVVQRPGASADCGGVGATFPVQFLAGSRVELADVDGEPTRFSDLTASFADGPEVLVARSLLKDVDRVAGAVAAMMSAQSFPFDRSKLRFIEDQEELKPTAPFVLVAPPRGGISRTGLSFDKGPVQVVDGQGAVLFAVDQLPRLSVVQLVKHGGKDGLWLAPAPAGGLPPAADFLLDQDDVAFLDDQGVVMTVNTLQPRVSEIDYPTYDTWFDLLGRYRVWLALLAWAVTAGLLVHFYRRSKSHSAGVR